MRFVVVAATDVDIGRAVGKEQNRSTSFKFTLFLSFNLQTDDSAQSDWGYWNAFKTGMGGDQKNMSNRWWNT